jgi:hypothetical protein
VGLEKWASRRAGVWWCSSGPFFPLGGGEMAAGPRRGGTRGARDQRQPADAKWKGGRGELGGGLSAQSGRVGRSDSPAAASPAPATADQRPYWHGTAPPFLCARRSLYQNSRARAMIATNRRPAVRTSNAPSTASLADRLENRCPLLEPVDFFHALPHAPPGPVLSPSTALSGLSSSPSTPPHLLQTNPHPQRPPTTRRPPSRFP